ncbi:TPA: hypothetical protein O5912_003145 [Legionella pneumophila]|uniref:hypothetical protein n=1 Tax=Legionella pneumophila TaxID=446 RepID=UPI0004806F04|nr:hypothetical protein [Legionella pneumophila]STY14445.1 Uncharacterised protein [Legionella pneumophila]HAT1740212.1 hypothetical protein [Legionella pneumophila]HAT1746168.1 hypothetical protein [Legionella pneumophila]HAT1749100.1 hypothetical protein [Legionella pneumophila]HAT1755108.1 hypothetical protein [Legionella pneumophila]
MRNFIIIFLFSLNFTTVFAYINQGIPVINKTDSDITITYRQCALDNRNECGDTQSASINAGIDRYNFIEFSNNYIYVTSIKYNNEIFYYADPTNINAVSKLANDEEQSVLICRSTYGTALEIINIDNKSLKCIQRRF